MHCCGYCGREIHPDVHGTPADVALLCRFLAHCGVSGDAPQDEHGRNSELGEAGA